MNTMKIKGVFYLLVFVVFSRSPSLMKSHLLKQNNNRELNPQASPRLDPDSTTNVPEAVTNGRMEKPKPVQTQPVAQPSPGLTEVLSAICCIPTGFCYAV